MHRASTKYSRTEVSERVTERFIDERITSFDVVREVAAKGNVGTVLLASFVKAGESIRISVRLQDVSSGRVLTSDKVEGVGESSIFPMVDDLTRRIKAQLDVPEAPDERPALFW